MVTAHVARVEEHCLSVRERGQELGQFLAKAVTVGTRSGSKSDWKEWLVFLEKERGEVGGGRRVLGSSQG